MIDKLMENLPHYKAQYNAAKEIHVYYIPATDAQTGTPIYFYAIASEMLHGEMMKALEKGVIPHFAVVVEKGNGIPPKDEVKAKIKAYYGFDHDLIGCAKS
jgi:hypothetical protein